MTDSPIQKFDFLFGAQPVNFNVMNILFSIFSFLSGFCTIVYLTTGDKNALNAGLLAAGCIILLSAIKKQLLDIFGDNQSQK